MPFLVASYYTEGTPYEQEAADLRASCERFGLRHHIQGVPNLGSWSKNCCHKPVYLLEQLERYNCPIVWTDADSLFVAKPTLFYEPFPADIAVRVCPEHPIDSELYVLSGTLFLNNTDNVKRLLHAWIEGNSLAIDPYFFDQLGLNYALCKTQVRTVRLPQAYIHIQGEPIKEPPVIVHTRASRLYQKIQDGQLHPAFGADTTDALRRVRAPTE